MKKSKLIATVLLLTMFSSLITVVNFSSPTSGSSVSPATPVASPDALGDPMGTKGILIATKPGAITVDGSLADWSGAQHDVFNGVDTYIGNDSTMIYVAVAWVDSSKDGKVSEWNKTGATLDNTTHAAWAELDGADDMVSVGFSNGTYTDMWTWTYSLRNGTTYAYESNSTGGADAGNLPFVRNLDAGPAALGWDQPATDNLSAVIPDQGALANGTAYKAWFGNTPTGSQTDVDVAWTWNATGDNRYIVEFSRLQILPKVDDISLDLNNLTNMSFFVGKANKQNFLDMDVNVDEYALADDNEAMEFHWDIVTDEANSAMLLTGTIYDDYENVEIWIRLSGWDDTYGAGFWWDYAGGINTATGAWSALFYYDEDDMPLGFQQINVSVHAKYDALNNTYQNITIIDDTSPQVVGLVDMNERYPNGVPNGTEYVPITVGANDDYQYWVGGETGYTSKDNLIVNLYSWADDDVALMVPMTQFSTGGTTFSANITLPALAAGETHNYTYFVQVFDPENNKITSQYYWFIHGDITPVTPGFGILVGLFGLAGAAFIIYKKRK